MKIPRMEYNRPIMNDMKTKRCIGMKQLADRGVDWRPETSQYLI
jgi:hypothetical protein